MRAGTPRGLRDILGDEALLRERISMTVRKTFSDHGYLPVETPLLEDWDVMHRAGRIKGSPFRLFDSDGQLLMLRPDLTMPIARLAATRLGNSDGPLRLRYEAPVVREQDSLKGQPRQFTQIGVELIGGDGCASEVEVVALLAETLETLEVGAWRIVCGSVAPISAALEACAPSAEFREQAEEFVHASDLVGLDELIAEAGLTGPCARALGRIPRVGGGVEALDEVDALLAAVDVPVEKRGVDELRALASSLVGTPAEDRILFDFSIVNSFDYYTGLIFKAYCDGVAASLASGGRYDSLLTNFGMSNTAACGFALSLERLQEVLGSAGSSGIATIGARVGERPLRIAIPKGSLFGDTVSVLEAAGLPTAELKDVGRKLTVTAGDVEYIIVRAQDAPAFVGFGGADCGICGFDSLVEAELDLLQLVDLGFGACRFIVAEPRSAAGAAEKAYAWRGTVRVATKYPRITQAYYDRIGQQVDIIQLHGNIELGPLVGMTDRIVDITATGTTLRENDLVIVDDVMSCTARFFAGPAAFRCDKHIRDLSKRLAEVVEGSNAS